MGLSAHQSARAKTVVWLTPPDLIGALGRFDLDPCAANPRPWDCGTINIALPQNGLVAQWFGRVWCNPPFDAKLAPKWLEKMAYHGNGIVLIPARTETRMFFNWVWGVADAVCFVRGRPHFYTPDGRKSAANSGAPICLIAYGQNNADVLKRSQLGAVVDVRHCNRDGGLV